MEPSLFFLLICLTLSIDLETVIL